MTDKKTVKIFMILCLANFVMSLSSQKSESQGDKEKKDLTPQNFQKLQDVFKRKLSSTSKLSTKNLQSSNDIENSSRKSKSLPYFPFFPPPMYPFPPPPPPIYYPQNKEITENSYPAEWLSRTEPFKKNQPLLDSPTYYIRLPPNPYAFVPGIGYISRPPSLSDPEVLSSNKYEQRPNQVGNDILQDSFYRLPINFVSNGKPTSVYQLANEEPIQKPQSSFINLDKGPYVFNGKPSEIFLIAQIYNALYGDELDHFYP